MTGCLDGTELSQDATTGRHAPEAGTVLSVLNKSYVLPSVKQLFSLLSSEEALIFSFLFSLDLAGSLIC